MLMLTEAIKLTLFPAMMAFAASSDLFTMTIANRVSLVLVAGFGLLALLVGMSAADVALACRRGGGRAGRRLCLFTRGWIGGGDAKLAAATVLWLGFAHLADYLVYASLLGGALTLAIIQFRPMPLPQTVRRPRMGRAAASPRRRRSLRHRARGGGAVVYPHTEWMAAITR